MRQHVYPQGWKAARREAVREYGSYVHDDLHELALVLFLFAVVALVLALAFYAAVAA